MAEYINKKDLIDFIKDTRQRLPHDSKDFFTRDNMLLNFEQIVSQMPAVDTLEPKHGEWENFEIPHMMRCSECGVSDLDIHHSKFIFCPYCGAKMDGTPKERGGEK